MMFETRFQILALAASLTASAFAGYLLAVPGSSLSSDRFAMAGDSGQRSTIFTEFGNEAAWEQAREKVREDCAGLGDHGRNGNGLLERLVRHISDGSPTAGTAVPEKICPAR